jgi:hypothetical protein
MAPWVNDCGKEYNSLNLLLLLMQTFSLNLLLMVQSFWDLVRSVADLQWLY